MVPLRRRMRSRPRLVSVSLLLRRTKCRISRGTSNVAVVIRVIAERNDASDKLLAALARYFLKPLPLRNPLPIILAPLLSLLHITYSPRHSSTGLTKSPTPTLKHTPRRRKAEKRRLKCSWPKIADLPFIFRRSHASPCVRIGVCLLQTFWDCTALVNRLQRWRVHSKEEKHPQSFVAGGGVASHSPTASGFRTSLKEYRCRSRVSKVISGR